MTQDYTALYSKIEIVKNDTNGLVSLSLIKRHGQDRATKVKNNFTGQLVATDSQTLLSLAKVINSKLPKAREGEIVIGMMTSGVIMCGYLALVRNSRFNYSIHDKNGDYEKVFHFAEGHREDKAHYLYGIHPNDEVIIIEDEVTSGNGIIAAVTALRDYGVTVNGVATVNEILNFDARRKIREETGIELVSLVESKLIP